MTTKTKIITISAAIVFAALAIAIYIKFFFVFGDGVVAGELNYFSHKGYIFKTYEGKLIQTGFNAKQGGVQSYEFRFSVSDQVIADSLMKCSGRSLELGYQEYFGILPWRGVSKFVVNEIITVR